MKASKRKLLLVANTAWYLYNFNLSLAKAAADSGFEVVMVAPPGAYSDRLRALGYRFIPIAISREGINPFREAWTLLQLVRIYMRERPSLVHHFTIKCVLYGTMAAKICRISGIVNSITGLGHVFLTRHWRTLWMRPLVKGLYRLVLKRPRVHVVFLNSDDRQVFLQSGLVNKRRNSLIKGPGVDMVRFSRDRNPPDSSDKIVIIAARLLVEKGLLDYVEAARLIRARHPDVIFDIAGEPDPGNPSSISADMIESWRKEGQVRLLGHVDPIENALIRASIVVLPSYREGVPKVLLEAAALCKPIVATDVPGCRDVVEDGVTGFLVPVRDSDALAHAIMDLLSDPVRGQAMGKAGRRKVEREFSDECVISATMAVYRELGSG